MPRLDRFADLLEVPGLAHGVTTRAGGVSRGPFASLNLGRTPGEAPDAVAENRRRAARALAFERLVLPHQVHGAEVRRVDGDGAEVGRCDGLSTNRPGLLLGVLGADCPGVLLLDPGARALAVVHAGWRGVAAGIVGVAVAHMQREYGSRPGDLRAGIGPGISRRRYEVSEEVADEIRRAVPADAPPDVAVPGRPEHAHVDLVAAIASQLRDAGLPAGHVSRHGGCTYDDARFFSHRRDAGRTGRHALLAGWQAPGWQAP